MSGRDSKPPVENDGGLYKNVNVSISTLNWVIIGGIVLLLVLIFMGTRNGGYTVTYNSMGGSDVAEQTYQYQEELVYPETPERQGYKFDGWYLDENLNNPADPGMPVEQSMILYARWSPE